MNFILCRIKTLQENICHMMMYICVISNDGTHMFPDNLVETDILITMTLITDKLFYFRFMK